MITARTRSEAIALRAAECLARELAKLHGIDAKILLECSLADASDEQPPMVPTFTKVHTRTFVSEGVRPEDM